MLNPEIPDLCVGGNNVADELVGLQLANRPDEAVLVFWTQFDSAACTVNQP